MFVHQPRRHFFPFFFQFVVSFKRYNRYATQKDRYTTETHLIKNKKARSDIISHGRHEYGVKIPDWKSLKKNERCIAVKSDFSRCTCITYGVLCQPYLVAVDELRNETDVDLLPYVLSDLYTQFHLNRERRVFWRWHTVSIDCIINTSGGKTKILVPATILSNSRISPRHRVGLRKRDMFRCVYTKVPRSVSPSKI